VSTGRGRARDRLTHLGERPVNGPNPRFAFSLERRLVQRAGLVAGATLVALPTRHRSLMPALTLGAGALATVVLAGALLGTFGPGGSDVLSLAAAVDTTVVMPGGHTVAGRTGLELPNGSVVWTGPNGSASAGTVEIGPGIEAIVDACRMRLSPLGANTAPTASAPATVPAATATTVGSGSSPATPPVVALPSVPVPRGPPPTVPTTVAPTTTTIPRLRTPVTIRRR
jgi:hypothetical protein